jgi:hypothetical protein
MTISILSIDKMKFICFDTLNKKTPMMVERKQRRFRLAGTLFLWSLI